MEVRRTPARSAEMAETLDTIVAARLARATPAGPISLRHGETVAGAVRGLRAMHRLADGYRDEDAADIICQSRDKLIEHVQCGRLWRNADGLVSHESLEAYAGCAIRLEEPKSRSDAA